MTDKLTIQDCRDIGFCIQKGVKPKCAALGVDFRIFARDGLDLEQARAFGDGQIDLAVAQAEKRIRESRRG